VRPASACALGPAVVRWWDWIGLDWIGLSTFICYMAGLQFEPMGMYCSILYTSGGFDVV
jgi:hypothetical protein